MLKSRTLPPPLTKLTTLFAAGDHDSGHSRDGTGGLHSRSRQSTIQRLPIGPF